MKKMHTLPSTGEEGIFWIVKKAEVNHTVYRAEPQA